MQKEGSEEQDAQNVELEKFKLLKDVLKRDK